MQNQRNLTQDAELGGSQEQSVGFYANGSLLNASRMPDQGYGFRRIFLSNFRGYGNQLMIDLLQMVAAQVKTNFPKSENMQIGDISALNGGKISGHDSHQIGLDADVVFYRTDHTEQNNENNGNFSELFVQNGKITSNYDLERNWHWIKTVVHTGWVNRIFVDRVIKLALCDYALKNGELAKEAESLRRLRHWPNHDTHFHMRLKCPPNSPRCVTQVEPPEGDGCAATFEKSSEDEIGE